MTVRARIVAALATSLLVLGNFAAAPVLAQDGGRTGASLPAPKVDNGSLTYDTFTNSSCSQAGFSTDAVAHLEISGHVFIEGHTFLNGVPYDTYAADLQQGPDTFNTSFFRPRIGDPPFGAVSSTYTFTFRSRVRRDDTLIGHSVTTITCANGVFSAENLWEPATEPIPAGTPATWAALALLLAAAAMMRLRTRRA